MKAVRVLAPGSFPGLQFVDTEDVPLGPRDVRIAVRAASLNYRDLLIATGHYPGPLKTTPVPLSDGAGEVIEVGTAVTRARIGDRVAANCYPHWIGGPFVPEYNGNSVGMTVDGMLAQRIVLDENALVHLPDYMSFEEGASLPCAAVSAWSALHVHEPLRPGQTVLVQGTGGVALFALQIARRFNARVLAITSSADKAARLTSLGADAVINYNERPDWDAAILDLTNGRGVDKVVEIGGEKTIQRSVACTRYGGELGLVGFVTGFGGGLPPIDIMARSVCLRGIAIGPRLNFEAVLDAMATAELRPVIDRTFAFEDFRSAYAHLQSGQHVGKVVIAING
jgi:NADPH:quinone reductase-like Zn-dependent oxidoreductase